MTQTTIAATTTTTAPRCRATAAMTPVFKKTRNTFIGGPDSGRTRRECWSATSADGTWLYERMEDEGTSWYVTYLPTGYCGDTPYGTLTSARRATHSGTALQRMINECAEVATNDRWPADCRADAKCQMAALLASRVR